ncbi:MAG: phosphopentomutase [Rhodothermales bacterium]|nr:phosphopentomutase [Rhodothermales bacterium]
MFVTIVLDGVGIGAQPDADGYGDVGAHTLGHVCAAERPHLPNLARLGLGRLADLAGVPAVEAPAADFGVMEEVSAGKDSTTGHWELAGLRLDRPFPTYPHGFPPEVVERFVTATGCGGVLANKPASGTAVIAEYGAEHVRTGRPILYTSADSVFQVAAHKGVVPLETLYAWCRTAREEVCVGEHAVGRVIARPFVGEEGAYERVASERRDFSRKPTDRTLQEALQAAAVTTVAVGKIGDLFGDVGFDRVLASKGNDEGVERTLGAIRDGDDRTFIWTNLVDFDQLYGHRNDPAGFARALEAFDRALPDLLGALPPGARLAITADHGNDPCFPGTDHTRERVPLLLYQNGAEAEGRPLGLRRTFADHAASVAAHFGVGFRGSGASFLG